MELSAAAKQAVGEENSISDIRKFFEEGSSPLAPGELMEFWKSLTEEEKTEFKKANLGNR